MKYKIIKTTIIFLISFMLFAIWYDYQYSMRTASSYEVNSSSLTPKLLIATQGSLYKNLITGKIVETLKPQNIYIKIIDVSELSKTTAEEWDGILIAHTWEIGVPPEPVKNFIGQTNTKHKIITLATSGEGTHQIEGVDAITSASVIEEAYLDVNVLLLKIKQILKLKEISKLK